MDKTRILPAEEFDRLMNVEYPELYAVFPIRLFTKAVGADAFQIGINPWGSRRKTANIGWQQQTYPPPQPCEKCDLKRILGG